MWAFSIPSQHCIIQLESAMSLRTVQEKSASIIVRSDTLQQSQGIADPV